uniref:Uncharacterized protein n=1 Tax=Lactuca sativa TaxID=4236 RepID=A0A9R1UMQ1_LACSA|nr:hypothetical protein LSAT_V11C800427780 [Lactuca sativa]
MQEQLLNHSDPTQINHLKCPESQSQFQCPEHHTSKHMLVLIIADDDGLSLQFSKQAGRVVEECKLKEPGEGALSPKVSFTDGGININTKTSDQATSLISQLTDEKNVVVQQSNKIRQEMVRRHLSHIRAFEAFSFLLH